MRLNLACDRAVLTDWGYAAKIGHLSHVAHGTPAYAPPEQLTGYCADSVCGRRPLAPSVDVWSLGSTLLFMLTGKPPFSARNFDEIVRQVVGLEYDMPRHVPREAAELVEGMLQLSPCDRLSVEELVANDWVRHSRFAQEPLTAGAAVCEVSDDDGAKGARTFFDRHRAQLRRLGVGLLYVMLCALLLARELRPTS